MSEPSIEPLGEPLGGPADESSSKPATVGVSGPVSKATIAPTPRSVSQPADASVAQSGGQHIDQPIHERAREARDGSVSDDVTGGAPDPELAVLAAFGPELKSATAAATHALIEALDRDGHVRQSWPVLSWPLTIGRALDNDIVLTEPHVAAHHLRLSATASTVTVTAGDTRNGLMVGQQRVDLGRSLEVPVTDGDFVITIGRTRLRLRVPSQAVAPEQVLSAMSVREQRFVPSAVAALLLLASVAGATWLDTDPDGFVRTVASTVLATLFGAAIWCAAWALLSKVITRQSHLGWHVRVFLVASLVLTAVSVLTPMSAFAFAAPWISSYDFVGLYVIGAAAIYFHLLGVEPARERLMRGVAVVGALVGIGVSMWFNVQKTGRTGDELYMNHLFPPALRVAKPKTVDQLVEGLAPLQAKLDRMARDPDVEGDDGSDKDGEDD